jgi:hypothetical protein
VIQFLTKKNPQYYIHKKMSQEETKTKITIAQKVAKGIYANPNMYLAFIISLMVFVAIPGIISMADIMPGWYGYNPAAPPAAPPPECIINSDEYVGKWYDNNPNGVSPLIGIAKSGNGYSYTNMDTLESILFTCNKLNLEVEASKSPTSTKIVLVVIDDKMQRIELNNDGTKSTKTMTKYIGDLTPLEKYVGVWRPISSVNFGNKTISLSSSSVITSTYDSDPTMVMTPTRNRNVLASYTRTPTNPLISLVYTAYDSVHDRIIESVQNTTFVEFTTIVYERVDNPKSMSKTVTIPVNDRKKINEYSGIFETVGGTTQLIYVIPGGNYQVRILDRGSLDKNYYAEWDSANKQFTVAPQTYKLDIDVNGDQIIRGSSGIIYYRRDPKIEPGITPS